MCLNQVWAKKAEKEMGPRMVLTHDLPTPPILQKEAFLAQKMQVYDLPFLPPNKPGRSYTWPLDGLNT